MEDFGGRTGATQFGKAMRRLRTILEDGRHRGRRPPVADSLRMRRIESAGAVSARSLATAARRSPRLRRLAGSSPVPRSPRSASRACGRKLSHPTTADNEGEYVDAGAITYQVQGSRQLNPYAPDEQAVPDGGLGDPAHLGQEWFGMFLCGQDRDRAGRSDDRQIRDRRHAGPPLLPDASQPPGQPFCVEGADAGACGIEPTPDGAAGCRVSPQRQLLLFRLSDTVYSDRPLTLRIFAPGQARPSTVSLDL